MVPWEHHEAFIFLVEAVRVSERVCLICTTLPYSSDLIIVISLRPSLQN